MNLFCYGTLMHPQIIKAILGRLPCNEAARLPGYQIYSVRSAAYPAIVQSEASVVEGIVYQDVKQSEIILLDEYEGEEYSREISELNIGENFFSVSFYVYKTEYHKRLTIPCWDYEGFLQKSLTDYLKCLGNKKGSSSFELLPGSGSRA